MNIDRLILEWAQGPGEVCKMLKESKTPHDERTIMASMAVDVSDEKMAPTKEFLETAYYMLREKFFKEEEMPTRLIFEIKNAIRSSYLGTAKYQYNNWTQVVTPLEITLNSSRTLTLHEWLEVVLHEMIHIYDYRNNPQHFLGFNRRAYDSHGTWFLDFGKQFEKDGFHVQKYCNADIGINTENNRIKNMIKNSVFLQLVGMETNTGDDVICKVSAKDVDNIADYIADGHTRGRFKGLNGFKVFKSENPNIARLKQIRMKNSRSGVSYYFFDDKFKSDYGPFEEVREIKPGYLEEDKDETDYDEMNRLDDSTAKKMYDNIKGVVDVKKIKDGEYEVSIF